MHACISICLCENIYAYLCGNSREINFHFNKSENYETFNSHFQGYKDQARVPIKPPHVPFHY